jgi:cobalamin biosynthesis protein CobD/CbiB
MCKRNKELVDHLFIVMWLLLFGVFFFNCFGMSWVMCIRVIYLYDCWWSFDRPRSVAVRKMVPMCVLWCLWEEMNDRNFEDRERFMGYIICWLFLVIFFFILSFLVKLFLFYTSCVLKGASHFQ